MRIVILTLPLHTNYGGILQCYALQTMLQRMGHNVKVLSKPRYGLRYYLTFPFLVIKNIYKKFFLGVNVRIFEMKYFYSSEKIDSFIKRYIHKHIRRYYNASIGHSFDVIVVGSDQIWRPMYSCPIEQSFLSFLGETQIRRIAYAASFGVDYCEYTKEQLKTCSLLLKKFDAISVRESSAVELCHNYFGVDVVQMIDPTLLLSADDYRVLINNAETCPSKGNMLVYILDKTEEKISLVNKIAAEKGLTPFWLDSPEDHNDEKQVKMSVEQWLRSFDDASFIYTDSFHGCVFSIIFRKQFIAFGNKSRGLSRFNSLMKLLEVENRLILSYDEYKANMLEIDYQNLSDKLSYLQKQAILFLKSNIM